MSSLKTTLARCFEFGGVNSLLFHLQKRLLRPFIRAVNYHDVPKHLAAGFEEQISYFAENFVSVDLNAMREFCRGSWPHDRPGIIVSFDGGLRSHYEVAVPILERHNFNGWFMVPTDFLDVSISSQREWARTHQINLARDADDDPRIAMSWDELRDLDSRHQIVCHTRTHRRLSRELGDADLEYEISEAKAILEERLAHSVVSFAWVGGEEWSYSARAAKKIREADFEFSFMTNNRVIRPFENTRQLQRSNVEAANSMSLVRLTLSGFYDLLYWPKRNRVNRITSTADSG